MGDNAKEEYIPQNAVPGGVNRLNTNQLNTVLFQMKNCVCKISTEDKVGTGFFFKIPFPDAFNYRPVLITCNHVLNENSITKGKKINFTLDDGNLKNSIIIDDSRMLYTDEDEDITIIEIKPEDSINHRSYLEVDEKIYENIEEYINKSIYINHYQKGEEVSYSVGIVTQIGEITIRHNCDTEEGSSGSPILNLENFKVIGVHKGKNNTNLGTLLKSPIEKFYESHKNSKTKNEPYKPYIKNSFLNSEKTGNFYVRNI